MDININKNFKQLYQEISSSLHYRTFDFFCLLIGILILELVVCEVAGSTCQDGPLCSDRATKGECYKHPEDMLMDCPSVCLNPCLCNVASMTSDTACDCLVKARDGYCDLSQSQTDCLTTCAKVNSVSCGSLPAPSDLHAHLSTNSTKFMTSVTEVCNVGYKPAREKDQGMKYCMPNGKWEQSFFNGKPVVCQLVDCRDPPPIQNGSVSYSSTIGGSEAKYTCNMGYTGRNNANQTTLICADNETWSGSWLECEKIDCGVPPTPVGSDVTYLQTDYGANSSYGCQLGYVYKQGDLVLTCSLDGSWQDTPIVCEFIDCGTPPLLPHTTFVSNGTTFGQTANYTCELGHLVSGGEIVLTCDSTGIWSGSSLTCTAIDCLSPPVHPNTLVQLNSTTFGHEANYTCQQGYISSQTLSTLLCDSDGQWKGSVSPCQAIDCLSPPVHPNTLVQLNSTTFGHEANYTCQQGYISSQTLSTLLCDSDGQWKGLVSPCQAVDCHTPPTAPNAVLGVTDTTFGCSANYTCVPGYQSSLGQVSLLCAADGHWTGSLINCSRKDCGSPLAIIGTKLVYKSTLYESMAVYVCESGYEQVTGDDVHICDIDGRWAGTPLSCTAVVCGDPPVYPGTKMWSPQGQHPLKYKDQVHYDCLDQVTGTQGLRWTLECGAQKQWIGAEPQCTGTTSISPSQFNSPSAESKFGWFLGAGILAVIVSFIALLLVLTVAGKQTIICRKSPRKTNPTRTKIKHNESENPCNQTRNISVSSMNLRKPVPSISLPYIEV